MKNIWSLLLVFSLLCVQPCFAGWIKDNNEIWHYVKKDGTYVTSQYKNNCGKKLYLDEKGDLATLYYLQDDKGNDFFFDEKGLKVTTTYAYVLINSKTKSNKTIDKEYALKFNKSGQVISKTVYNGESLLIYIDARNSSIKDESVK